MQFFHIYCTITSSSFQAFCTISPLFCSFSLSLASVSLPHKRNAYVCTKEYTLLDSFTKAAEQVVLQCSAYTNPAIACGQRCLAQGYPPSWTMKALLSKVIAVTDLAHGRLPLRKVSEAVGLRDLKLHTHTHTHTHSEALLHSSSQFNHSLPVTL